MYATKASPPTDVHGSAENDVLPGPAPTPERPAVVAIVASRDRAGQLAAALRSFYAHCQEARAVEVTAIWAASTPAGEAGYQALAAELPRVRFLRERDFRSDLLGVVSDSVAVLLFKDDTLFRGGFSLAASLREMADRSDALGVSFAVGLDTSASDGAERAWRPAAFRPAGPGFLVYDWRAAEGALARPLALDASFYRTADLLPVLQSLPFEGVGGLEQRLAERGDGFRGSHPLLICPEQSVAARNVPLPPAEAAGAAVREIPAAANDGPATGAAPASSYEEQAHIVEKLLGQGRNAEALVAVEAFLASHPGHVAATHDLAVLSNAAGNRGRALELLEALVAAHPAESQSRRALAELQLASGAIEPALRTLQPIMVGPRPDADAFVLAGDIARGMGQTAEAMELYRKALALKDRVA